MKNGEDKNMYKKILVTGGTGFVGTNLTAYLKQRYEPEGTTIISVGRELKLYDCYGVRQFMVNNNPDCVVHLAAVCGGIGANKDSPADFMFSNLRMGMNIIGASLPNVQKFIMTGTICAYPKYTKVPFVEEDIWSGYPEETNAPYGIAKKTLMELLIAENTQYGFESVNLIPTNMYGPHDHFNLDTSHVIPAIILKIYTAMAQGRGYITLWGTGEVSRDFLYVYDFCRAVAAAIENDPGPEPINIGTKNEITIKQLANKIAEIMGYNGEIRWDTSKPDGQPRRCVDSTKAYERLGYRAMVHIDRGLEKTIRWFLQNINQPKEYWGG
jgi:GDP-L-fucose synthase